MCLLSGFFIATKQLGVFFVISIFIFELFHLAVKKKAYLFGFKEICSYFFAISISLFFLYVFLPPSFSARLQVFKNDILHGISLGAKSHPILVHEVLYQNAPPWSYLYWFIALGGVLCIVGLVLLIYRYCYVFINILRRKFEIIKWNETVLLVYFVIPFLILQFPNQKEPRYVSWLYVLFLIYCFRYLKIFYCKYINSNNLRSNALFGVAFFVLTLFPFFPYFKKPIETQPTNFSFLGGDTGFLASPILATLLYANKNSLDSGVEELVNYLSNNESNLERNFTVSANYGNIVKYYSREGEILGNINITGWAPYSPKSKLYHPLYNELQEAYIMSGTVNAIISFNDVRFRDCPIFSYAEANYIERIDSDGDAILYIMERTKKQFEIDLRKDKLEILIPGTDRKMIAGIHRSLLPGKYIFSIKLEVNQVKDLKDELMATCEVIVSGDPSRQFVEEEFYYDSQYFQKTREINTEFELDAPHYVEFRAIFEKGYEIHIQQIRLRVL